MSKRRYLLVVLVVFAAIPVLVSLLHETDPAPPLSGSMTQFTVIDKPVPAPDTVFTDGAGEKRRLTDFLGRVVLVNFWATWCAPCIKEMPSLDALQAKLGGDDFAVVTLNEDRGGAAVAKPFLDKLGTRNLALYIDDKMALMRALDVRGLPTTFLVDREGRVRARLEGVAEWNSPEAEALMRHYLQ